MGDSPLRHPDLSEFHWVKRLAHFGRRAVGRYELVTTCSDGDKTGDKTGKSENKSRYFRSLVKVYNYDYHSCDSYGLRLLQGPTVTYNAP